MSEMFLQRQKEIFFLSLLVFVGLSDQIYFHGFRFSILNPSGDFSGCLLTDYLIMKVFVFLLLLNHITSMTQNQSINSVRKKMHSNPSGHTHYCLHSFSLASVSRDFDLDTQYNMNAAFGLACLSCANKSHFLNNEPSQKRVALWAFPFFFRIYQNEHGFYLHYLLTGQISK